MNIASEHDIIEAYRKHGSIKKVARELGVGKQRIRRLIRGSRIVDKKRTTLRLFMRFAVELPNLNQSFARAK